MTRIQKLSAIFGILLAASLLLTFTGRKSSRTQTNPGIFAISDTTSLVQLNMKQPTGEVVLKKDGGVWLVNNTYPLDRSLRVILMSVLQQVSVKRPVARRYQADIASALRDKGIEVTAIFNDGASSTFYAGGNATKTVSYFMEKEGDQPYVVEIPGYNNYLTGIFELTDLQWKDRLLFATTWRSLQLLEVDYPRNQAASFKIFFDKKFLAVDQVQPLDTTAMMDYLAAFEYFETNEFISPGQHPRYDSLSNTTPLATINVRDIDETRNVRLNLFPKLESDNYLLGVTDKGEMSIVEFRRIKPLLGKRADFVAEPSS